MAETPNAPSSEEEKQLAKQVALAEYKTKIAKAELEAAEAKKKLLTLNDPLSEKDLASASESIATSYQKGIQAGRDIWKGPEVKPLEGKITAEGTFIESRILANKTLNNSFEDLVNSIKSHYGGHDKDLTFVIYNAADFSSIELYVGMLDQLEGMKSSYKTALVAADAILFPPLGQSALAGPADPLLAGYSIGGVLRTVADTLSLFKTNTTFSNFDLNIDETAMVASFIQAIFINKLKWTVFHPGVYPINTLKPTGLRSNFVKSLDELRSLNILATEKQKLIDKKLAELKAVSALEEIRLVEAIKEEIDRLLASFAQLETILGATDAASKINLQASIQRAERIVEKLLETDVFMIKFSAFSKGSNRIVDSIFRSASIKHSGGTELNCLLFAPDGSIVFSYCKCHYTPYQNADEIR